MTLEQTISDISQLTTEEQIVVAQAIWDRLSDLAVDQKLTSEQQAELDRRWADYQADKSIAIPLEQFKERIRTARNQ